MEGFNHLQTCVNIIQKLPVSGGGSSPLPVGWRLPLPLRAHVALLKRGFSPRRPHSSSSVQAEAASSLWEAPSAGEGSWEDQWVQ